MDHHCAITDNCVGRQNLKYFLHFCSWAGFTLLSGLGIFWVQVYSFNNRINVGLKSVLELTFVTNPLSMVHLLVQGKLDVIGLFDSIYVFILFGLFAIVVIPMGQTILNTF